MSEIDKTTIINNVELPKSWKCPQSTLAKIVTIENHAITITIQVRTGKNISALNVTNGKAAR